MKLYLTYTQFDLRDHALAASDAARRLGWEVIDGPAILDALTRQAALDTSDVFLLLSAGFYSEIGHPGLSYQEAEWDAARASGVPSGALVLDEASNWQVRRIQREPDKVAALAKLHTKLRASGLVGQFSELPESVHDAIFALLPRLLAAADRRQDTKLFVVWDVTIDGLDLILASLRKKAPQGWTISVPALDRQGVSGEIFRDVVLKGLLTTDRVLVVTDKPNANVAFEAGLALGFGKAVSLVHFGEGLPRWLELSAFKGFAVTAVQDITDLRATIVNENSWYRPSPPQEIPANGNTLFLTPHHYVGSAVRESQVELCPHWKALEADGFNVRDLNRELGRVAQVVWCIASFSEGVDQRDGAENAANGLVFGWFYARAYRQFGDGATSRHFVVRHQGARKVVDVEVIERRFSSMDQFARTLGEISKHDLRLPRPRQLEEQLASKSGYRMNRIPLPAETSADMRELWVGVYPVTNKQYKSFCGATDHLVPEAWETHEPDPDEPVVGVSLEDAEAFCAWADLELPDESMWRHFALAGSKTAYWWGEDSDLVPMVAWYRDNSQGVLHRVGGRLANTWGLHDVFGNAWEWTARYKRSVAGRYQDKEFDVTRARVCGGAYDSDQLELLRSVEYETTAKQPWIGFRCISR